MKRQFITLIILLIGIVSIVAQPSECRTLDPDSGAFASLLTCGPGEEFYESFGHSAIRVSDSSQGIDVVFNYGSFDFAERHFYLKFASGTLNYFVMPQSFAEFMFEYQYYGRAVWEQRLILSHEELNKLFQALVENVQPENMYYRYDLFRDNCATRVHNIVADNMEGSHLRESDANTVNNVTYRDLIYKYTAKKELWWQFGVDMLLGARCDRRLTDDEIIMMPLDMMARYDTMQRANGDRIAEKAVEITPQSVTISDTVVSPTVVFMMLFLIVMILTIFGRKHGWKLRWLDGLLFGAAGITSLFLLFMWFGSEHWCTKWNFNLLWANPLFIWLLIRPRNRGVAIALLVCLIATLLIWIAGYPQCINSAALLIVLTLLLRVKCQR